MAWHPAYWRAQEQLAAEGIRLQRWRPHYADGQEDCWPGPRTACPKCRAVDACRRAYYGALRAAVRQILGQTGEDADLNAATYPEVEL
jgi:hypothetical protein